MIALGLFLCFLGKKSVKVLLRAGDNGIVQHVRLRSACRRHSDVCARYGLAERIDGVLRFFRGVTCSEKQAFWISIGSSCVMGIIVGILLVCLFQIGYFVIGAAFGAVVAVYSDVILDSIIRFHSDVVLYVAIGAFALEFGLFAMVWDK